MSGATLAVEVVNGNPAERLLVIAPSLQRAVEWCRANGVNPRARNVVTATRSSHLRGYGGGWYAFLGVPGTADGDFLRAMWRNMRAMHDWKNAEVIPGATAAGEEGT